MKLSATGFGVVTVAALSALILGPQAPADARSLSTADFDGSLASLSSLLLVGLSAWILVCVALTILARHTAMARRLSRTITPAFLRRALFLGAAGALAVGPVSASGQSGQGPEDQFSGAHGSSSVGRMLDGLRLPDRPVGSMPAPSATVGLSSTYVVRAGDTLWEIASRDLDPTTSPTVIAAVMRRWYAANRAVIGADPNLILPGQHLTRPAKALPTKDES